MDRDDSPPRFFAILPCCGQSVRMGRPKLLLPWGEGTVIDAVVQAWRTGGVERIVAVVRDDDPQLHQQLSRHDDVAICLAHQPPDMTSSLRCGLRYLQEHEQPQPTAAWLFAPADMPRLAPKMIRTLCLAHQPHVPAAIVPTINVVGILRVPTNSERRGHPVLLPWAWQERIQPLPAAVSLRDWLSQQPTRFIACDDLASSAKAFADIDSPADYDRLRP